MSEFIGELSGLLTTKKGVALSTATVYIKMLLTLNNKKPFKNLVFLKKKDEIVNKISTYAETTQKTFYAAIVSVLSLYDKPTYKAIYKFYYDKMMGKAKEAKEAATGDKTEKQKENWVEWKWVVEKKDELMKELPAFANNKNLSPSEYEKLLQLLVLSLYVCVPPRRNQDYLNMFVVKKHDEKMPQENNYLDLDSKKFIFNKYKTAKKYGEQTVSIPDDMMNIINIYLKHNSLWKGVKGKLPVPFLVSSKGEAIGAVNAITRILNRIFGKKVGSSMLRHIFLTDKYGEVKDDMAADAEAMGHSVGEQQNTYVVK
jgi:integrase